MKEGSMHYCDNEICKEVCAKRCGCVCALVRKCSRQLPNRGENIHHSVIEWIQLESDETERCLDVDNKIQVT